MPVQSKFWQDSLNFYSEIKRLIKYGQLTGVYTNKMDGSNCSIELVKIDDVWYIEFIYGRESILYAPSLGIPISIADIQLVVIGLYGNLRGNDCRIDRILREMYYFASNLGDILDVTRIRVYGEIYKVSVESWIPFGYWTNESMYTMSRETHTYFLHTYIKMYGELPPNLYSFQDIETYLERCTSPIIVILPILFEGDYIEGLIFLRDIVTNVPEEYFNKLEGLVFSTPGKIFKAKTSFFSGLKKDLDIQEDADDRFKIFIGILNELKYSKKHPDAKQCIGEKKVFKKRVIVDSTESTVQCQELELKASVCQKECFENVTNCDVLQLDSTMVLASPLIEESLKLDAEIDEEINKAIIHELLKHPQDEDFRVLGIKIYCVKSLQKKIDARPTQEKDYIVDLIFRIKKEFNGEYGQEAPYDITETIYEKLIVNYESLQKNLPRPGKK
jgi:hypothetical protein